MLAAVLLLVSPPQRRTAKLRRLPHKDETAALQMVDQPLGDDRRLDLRRVVHALAPGIAQGKRQGVGKFVSRRGGRSLDMAKV